MRVAYLTEWSPYGETGVLRKMIGQVTAWRELGAAASLFCLATRQDREPALSFRDYGQVVGRVHQEALERYPFARLGYFNKIASVARMKAALKAFAPDAIYYRQNGPWYPGLEDLLAIAPAVLEINTAEASETKLWGRLGGALYRATASRLHRAAGGFVTVTNEIAVTYRRLGKPVIAIGNGMWDRPQALPPSGNTQPRFVFVGSPTVGPQSWHGVDKIFGLAFQLPDVEFEVAGLAREHFPESDIPANVLMHGQMSGQALRQIYLQSDVAISTLALHRLGIDEASPLKTREYLMYGLPVIIGYTEVEDGLNRADYVLSLPNREDNVATGAERIAEFARRWVGRRVHEDLTFLSSKRKAQESLHFLQGVVRQSL